MSVKEFFKFSKRKVGIFFILIGLYLLTLVIESLCGLNPSRPSFCSSFLMQAIFFLSHFIFLGILLPFSLISNLIVTEFTVQWQSNLFYAVAFVLEIFWLYLLACLINLLFRRKQ